MMLYEMFYFSPKVGREWGESGERKIAGAEREISNASNLERYKLYGRQVL
jgi:hypothetical protein